jgi:hypothetical protein
MQSMQLYGKKTLQERKTMINDFILEQASHSDYS